ncbi:MAG TPA: hypothetical protein VGW78_00345 [Candidatus Babeliales bacterium]|nr:hypothetical protein [Candidatus Babeliales bacterium]
MFSCMHYLIFILIGNTTCLAMDNKTLFGKIATNPQLQWITDINDTTYEFKGPFKKNIFKKTLPNLCTSPYHIACGDNLNALFVAHKHKGIFKQLPSAIEGPIKSMVFDRSGKELIVGYNYVAHRWNFLEKAWKESLSSRNHTLPYHSFDTLYAHPSQDTIIASGSNNGCVTLWNLQEGNILQQKILNKPVANIAFNASGNLLAILSSQGTDTTLSIWNIGTDTITDISYTDNPFRNIKNIMFSPDDSLLVMLENQQSISWCPTWHITNTQKKDIFFTQLEDIQLDTLCFGKNNLLIGINKNNILLLDIKQDAFFCLAYNKQSLGYSSWHPNTQELSLFKFSKNKDTATAHFYDFSAFYKQKHTAKSSLSVHNQIQWSFQAYQDVYEKLTQYNASERLINLFNKTLAKGDFINNLTINGDYYTTYIDKALRIALHRYLILKTECAYKKIMATDKNMIQDIKTTINENMAQLQKQLNTKKDIDFSLWFNRKNLMDRLLCNVERCPICLEYYKDIIKYGKANIMLQLICKHRLCKTCWQHMLPGNTGKCHLCRKPFILNMPSLQKLASSRLQIPI